MSKQLKGRGYGRKWAWSGQKFSTHSARNPMETPIFFFWLHPMMGSGVYMNMKYFLIFPVPISHGYTLESKKSLRDDFLSYPIHATVKIFSKRSFYNNDQQIWEVKVKEL